MWNWKRWTVLFAALCLMPLTGLATGSWGQINQEIVRPDGWRQIVTDRAFVLGDIAEAGMAGDVVLFTRNFGTYPSMDGSTVAVPMAVEFARQHLGLSENDLQDFVHFSTTHGAYDHLIHAGPNGAPVILSESVTMDAEQPVDIIIATEPSDLQLAEAEAAGVVLIKEPVCYDAFVFITHQDNPIEGLTLQQVRDIYTGKVTNWADVGGENRSIVAYQREKNSGSQTAMENLVMQGEPITSAREITTITTMSGLVERVGSYANSRDSLGYTYQYYIDTLYRNEDIKVLAIDGVYPDAENLRNGTYPLAANYYGVIRESDRESTGGKFLAWMLSEEGQRCIEQAGYIPMEELP